MNNATRILAATIGVVCGISGLEHGFFETLQGNIIPEVHFISGQPMIYAIGDANRFWRYGFEYAFTLIPNFLLTGILAMIISSLVILWSAAYLHMKYGWLVLIVLSVCQYLVGGGAAQLGPAIIAGVAGITINHPLRWRFPFPSYKLLKVIGWPWEWLLGIFTFVFCHSIVTAVFGFFYGIGNPDTINAILYGMLYVMIALLPLAIISAVAHDSLISAGTTA